MTTFELHYDEHEDGTRVVENTTPFEFEVLRADGKVEPFPPGAVATLKRGDTLRKRIVEVPAVNVRGPAKYGRTLAEQWASWRSLVIPAAAGEVQVRESRRACSAGAQALQVILLHGVSDEAEMTDGDERLMRDIDAELQAFTADVKAGRA